MRESELVLGAGCSARNRPVRRGTVHRWPNGAAHTYQNPTDRYQSILCVDSPRFIESDEVVVEGAGRGFGRGRGLRVSEVVA